MTRRQPGRGQRRPAPDIAASARPGPHAPGPAVVAAPCLPSPGCPRRPAPATPSQFARYSRPRTVVPHGKAAPSERSASRRPFLVSRLNGERSFLNVRAFHGLCVAQDDEGPVPLTVCGARRGETSSFGPHSSAEAKFVRGETLWL